jgi:hypothetical protein
MFFLSSTPACLAYVTVEYCAFNINLIMDWFITVTFSFDWFLNDARICIN